MRNSKHGLKALVLAIMVLLGAMAFAPGAQAQTHTELLAAHVDHNKAGGVLNPDPLTHGSGSQPGEFLLNLGLITLPVNISAMQEGIGILLIAGRVIEIRCTELTLNSGAINSSTDASMEATFTGCHTYNHKTLEIMPQCEFKTLLTIVAKFLVLPISHGGESFVLFEPQEGATTFTTISYKPNMGCTLPLNNPIAGAFSALVEQLDAVTQTLSFSEGIQLLTGDLLAFGGFPSYVTAKGQIAASGEHFGQKLGIHQAHSEKELEELKHLEELEELEELEHLEELD